MSGGLEPWWNLLQSQGNAGKHWGPSSGGWRRRRGRNPHARRGELQAARNAGRKAFWRCSTYERAALCLKRPVVNFRRFSRAKGHWGAPGRRIALCNRSVSPILRPFLSLPPIPSDKWSNGLLPFLRYPRRRHELCIGWSDSRPIDAELANWTASGRLRDSAPWDVSGRPGLPNGPVPLPRVPSP